MASNIFVSSLAICVAILSCNGCHIGPVRECLKSIPGIQSVKLAAETSPDNVIPAIANMDACVTFPQIKECLEKIPEECLDKVPDTLENFVLENTFAALSDSENCEMVSIYAKGFESVAGCMKNYIDTDEYKEDEKIMDFMVKKVTSVYEPICCALLFASRPDKEEYLKTCDELSQTVLSQIERESDKFLHHVCRGIDPESDSCKAHLSEIQ